MRGIFVFGNARAAKGHGLTKPLGKQATMHALKARRCLVGYFVACLVEVQHCVDRRNRSGSWTRDC